MENIDSDTLYTIDEIIQNVDEWHHPYYWEIYKDLLDTKCCPENFDFYNWSDINNHQLFNEIITYKNDFIDNINNVIEIVKEIIIDMYNGHKFEKHGKMFRVKEWVIEGLERCDDCGRIWDGCAQCDCYLRMEDY
jgi:hypothetical protein